MSCLNIAHRGASADAPENTFAAFALAIEQGADMIETDLHLSSDGQIAIYHDDVIGGSKVGDLTLAEMRATLPGVPTLDETLDAFGERIPFNLEFKRPRGGDYPGLEARVLDQVRKRGLLERTLFSCFYDSVLATLRELSPEAVIGLLISRRSSIRVEKRANGLGAQAVHPEVSLVTPAFVEEAHAKGRRVHVYTVDAPEKQRELIDLGVDGIFTNRPGQLREILS